MVNYIFICNNDKINEKIGLMYIGDDIYSEFIGNIYNLVDYINFSINDCVKIKFVNFTDNKINFVINAITKYKRIVSTEECYSIVIDNKKKNKR